MIDPAAAPLELVTILVATVLMLLSGLGKRQLEWRPRPRQRRRPPHRRRPRAAPDP